METERFHVSELIVILKQILSLPNESGTNACQLFDSKKCIEPLTKVGKAHA